MYALSFVTLLPSAPRSILQIFTDFTTVRQNFAETNRFAPSRHSNLPKRPQTCLTFRMFLRTASRFLSERCISRPIYLNQSSQLTISPPSSPMRLNIASVHLFAIATSRLCHLIYVFLSHISVCRCLIIRPAGKIINRLHVFCHYFILLSLF